jgi:hypothetical protein
VLFAIDPTGALLSGSSIDTLPAIPPGTATASFQVLEGTQPVVGATMTSLRVRPAAAPIPEPISTALLAVGGLVVGSAVRRRPGADRRKFTESSRLLTEGRP